MQKPQNCNQDWSKMTPAKGGRICGSCEKLIVDFRKKSWKEIETKQSANNNSLCGLYDQKQLDHWGKEVPKSNSCSKILLYTSMILSMNAATSELQGKTNIPLLKSEIIQTDQQAEQVQNKQHSNSLITITGKIIDEVSKEPLIGVTVQLKDAAIGTITNVEGNFTLKDINQKNITLLISYVGYEAKEIVLDESQLNQQNLTLGEIILTPGVQMTYFSITRQTPWQRFKSRVKRLFRKK